MLSVISWRWKPTGTWSREYHAEHVNALQRQCKAHLHIPHRFICITDDPKGIECETVPLWDQPDVKTLPNNPNCYKRLYAFSREAEKLFGPRFVSIDLDCLMLPGPDGLGITPLIDHKEPFKIVNGYRNNRGCCPYNGSMWMMDAGAREKVWTDFDPVASPALAHQNACENGKNYYGSDQAWIAHKIPGEKTWCKADGVMSYVRDYGERGMPKDCRVMFFAGHLKPWSSHIKAAKKEIWEEYKKYLN